MKSDPVRDELAIRNLVARMTRASDEEPSLDAYAALLSEDSVWEFEGQAPFEGRDAIVAGAAERRAQGLVGPGTHTRHVITTQSVEVAGDRARGECTCLFYAQTNSQPTLRALTRYRDEYVRSADGWKIARRVIRFG